MDAVALMERLPADAGFKWLAPADQKTGVETAITVVLDAIEAEDRQPDRWETGWLRIAITSIGTGLYLVAVRFVRMALTPADQRAPAGAPTGTDIDRRSLDELRAELDTIRASDVKGPT